MLSKVYSETEKCNTPPTEALKRRGTRLPQWPCKLSLVPPLAPYLFGADLVIAADCSAYAAMSSFPELARDAVTLIGCPRLEGGAVFEKLLEILWNNPPRSLKLIRLETDCCAATEAAVLSALRESECRLPLEITTVSTSGEIIDKKILYDSLQ